MPHSAPVLRAKHLWKSELQNTFWKWKEVEIWEKTFGKCWPSWPCWLCIQLLRPSFWTQEGKRPFFCNTRLGPNECTAATLWQSLLTHFVLHSKIQQKEVKIKHQKFWNDSLKLKKLCHSCCWTVVWHDKSCKFTRFTNLSTYQHPWVVPRRHLSLMSPLFLCCLSN